MLGLSGRDAIFDLLERIFAGDAKAALLSLNALHDKGGDPLTILTDASDAVHALSRLKAVPGLYPADFSAADRARADKLSRATLESRAWPPPGKCCLKGSTRRRARHGHSRPPRCS